MLYKRYQFISRLYLFGAVLTAFCVTTPYMIILPLACLAGHAGYNDLLHDLDIKSNAGEDRPE